MRKLFSRFITALIFLWVFGWILSIYQEISISESRCYEGIVEDSISLDRWHQRSWSVSSQASLCLAYDTKHNLSADQKRKRHDIKIQWYDSITHPLYWGQVYESLIKQSDGSLEFIVDSLNSVLSNNELSRNELAESIVSFVQDIPYTLITDEPCPDSIRCVPDEAFGILSPYEFLHSENGDCDTRTVLLFTLLSKFKFNPLILVSREYRHSMIAVDLQGYGEYIEFQGGKYYFWETTASGWRAGMLPPDSKNKDYWHIALAHEF